MRRNDSPNHETEPTRSTERPLTNSRLDGAASRRGFLQVTGLLAGGAGIGLSGASVDVGRAADGTQDIDDVEALNLMLRFERLHRDFYREFTEELEDALDGDHEDDDHEEDLEEEEEELEDEKDEIEEDLEDLEDERDEHREEEDDDDDHDDDDDEHEEEREEDFEEDEEELEEELEDVEDDLEEIRDEQDDHEDGDDDEALEGLVEQAFEERTGLHDDGVERFHQLADHEEVHVERVREAIERLGGTPAPETGFVFDDDGLGEFMATASSIGEATVEAYADLVPRISDPDVATEAMRLCVVEARHAAFVSALDGDDPFPEPFATRGSVTDAREYIEQFE